MEAVSIDINAEIISANSKLAAALDKADAQEMANLYTKEGMLLPTGSDMIKGREGIRTFWQGAIDMGMKQVKLETVEVEPHENTAIELGKYTLKGENNQLIDQGKYMVIWKREDKQWKLHKDMWNSSLPVQ
ncbi:uncharacterized protein (TIGR02246 family) [Pontibacter ummariensis]|uniref:DUF4440 domain-containing protein n=1 Tax=Pontibacter ummariensis TaxID=1610492 RepID=A0A239J376_9BACT|nr:SgcJ/EcaC family oxidoreductase [Pontibacter ummariensis]PRY08845.1 uncharacterized protein (TIGR02246 family) [Pontibacter ummariensis]SNS99928.1 conserved hypothetical protein [Pontibacter ummariensis]